MFVNSRLSEEIIPQRDRDVPAYMPEINNRQDVYGSNHITEYQLLGGNLSMEDADSIKKLYSENMYGDGIGSIASSAFVKLRNKRRAAARKRGIGTRDLEPAEWGHYGLHNWTGKGTNVDSRTVNAKAGDYRPKENSKPINCVDEASYVHDIDYYKAFQMPMGKERRQAIRRADEKAVSSYKKCPSSTNGRTAALMGINGKMGLEKYTPAMMKMIQGEEYMGGEGMKVMPVRPPGMKLKKKLIRQMKGKGACCGMKGKGSCGGMKGKGSCGSGLKETITDAALSRLAKATTDKEYRDAAFTKAGAVLAGIPLAGLALRKLMKKKKDKKGKKGGALRPPHSGGALIPHSGGALRLAGDRRPRKKGGALRPPLHGGMYGAGLLDMLHTGIVPALSKVLKIQKKHIPMTKLKGELKKHTDKIKKINSPILKDLANKASKTILPHLLKAGMKKYKIKKMRGGSMVKHLHTKLKDVLHKLMKLGLNHLKKKLAGGSIRGGNIFSSIGKIFTGKAGLGDVVRTLALPMTMPFEGALAGAELYKKATGKKASDAINILQKPLGMIAPQANLPTEVIKAGLKLTGNGLIP